MNNDLENAREFFAKDVFATKTTGIVIEDVKECYAKCSLKIDSRHINAMNNVMGGAIFTLADFTFAVASNFNQVPTVTTTSQITYLSGVKGDTLYSESRLIKNGRTTSFYEIEITDNLGTKVALVTESGMKIPPSKN